MQLSQLIYDLAAMIHAGGVPLTAAQAVELNVFMETPTYLKRRRLNQFEERLVNE